MTSGPNRWIPSESPPPDRSRLVGWQRRFCGIGVWYARRSPLRLTIMGRAEPPRTMKGRLAPDRSLTPTLSRRARERTRCANFIVEIGRNRKTRLSDSILLRGWGDCNGRHIRMQRKTPHRSASPSGHSMTWKDDGRPFACLVCARLRPGLSPACYGTARGSAPRSGLRNGSSDLCGRARGLRRTRPRCRLGE